MPELLWHNIPSCKSQGKRALSALFLTFLLFFHSCCKPSHEWYYEKLPACYPCRDISRLVFPEDGRFCGIEIELVSDLCSTRIYLNTSMLEFPSLKDDPFRSEVTMVTESGSRSFVAERFSGGQRLLLTDEARDFLINNLHEGAQVFVSVDGFSADIRPCNAEWIRWVQEL